MTPTVILVTAGSAGLGAAAARLFAKSGYRVVINFSSNESRAQALREELELLSPPHKPPTAAQLGNPGSLRADPEVFGTHITLRADLTKRNEIVELVKDTMDWLGRLDVVFSNGGWTAMRDFSDLDDNVDEEDWDKCFNMNVKSHLWLMHAARSYLDESEGAFITTASLAGVRPSGSSLAYSVTKAAQIHLVKGLASIAGPKIRVNSVSPGILMTDWGKQFSQERLDTALAKTKLKKFATVEDVADQVLCFARSKSVTGANAVIDAGWSL